MSQDPDHIWRLEGPTDVRDSAGDLGHGGRPVPWHSCGYGDLIAPEIVDDLEAALEQFRLIAGDLAAEATQE